MALHKITHSQGFVVISARDGVLPPELSFRVVSGHRVPLAGWTHAGYVPEIPINPPGNPRNVLTVGLADNSPETFNALRDLIGEHQGRFSECMVWLAPGASRDLRRWVTVGCPPLPEGEPDEENSEGDKKDPGKNEGPEVEGPEVEEPEKADAWVTTTEEPAPEPTTANMRAWAKEQGIDVPDRGRLPVDVVRQFHAAHNIDVAADQ